MRIIDIITNTLSKSDVGNFIINESLCFQSLIKRIVERKGSWPPRVFSPWCSEFQQRRHHDIGDTPACSRASHLGITYDRVMLCV